MSGTSVFVIIGGATGIKWVGARDAVQYPTLPRMGPQSDPAPMSAKGERLPFHQEKQQSRDDEERQTH